MPDRESESGRQKHSYAPAGRRTRRELLLLFGMALPALGWLGYAQGYPLLYSLYLSFQRWSLVDSSSPQGFAGLSNFKFVLLDAQFQYGLRLSVLLLLSVIVELVLGFILAYFTLGEGKGMRSIRTLLIIPMVIAPIAVGTIWRLLLNSDSGLVNALLGALGLGHQEWLSGQWSAVLSMIFVDIWEWIPFSMIIYSAALSGLDPSLLESARMDGASAWRTIRHIMLPLTMPATLLICVFRLIDAFLVFDISFSLLYGGPGFATSTSTLYTYNQGLKYFNISQAAAASWILLIICLALATVVLRAKNGVERRLGGR